MRAPTPPMAVRYVRRGVCSDSTGRDRAVARGIHFYVGSFDGARGSRVTVGGCVDARGVGFGSPRRGRTYPEIDWQEGGKREGTSGSGRQERTIVIGHVSEACVEEARMSPPLCVWIRAEWNSLDGYGVDDSGRDEEKRGWLWIDSLEYLSNFFSREGMHPFIPHTVSKTGYSGEETTRPTPTRKGPGEHPSE